jgi:hypothetical protein
MKKQIVLSAAAFALAIVGAFASVKTVDLTPFYRPNPASTANCTSAGPRDCGLDSSQPVCTAIITGIGTRTLYRTTGCAEVVYVDPD